MCTVHPNSRAGGLSAWVVRRAELDHSVGRMARGELPPLTGHLFRATKIDVMQRQPRAHERPILDAFGAWRVIFFVGLTLLALTICAFFWTKSRGAYDELGARHRSEFLSLDRPLRR